VMYVNSAERDLGEEGDLGDERIVGDHHGHWAEESLQVVGQLRASCAPGSELSLTPGFWAYNPVQSRPLMG